MSHLAIIKNSIVILTIIAMVWWFHLQNRNMQTYRERGKPQEYMANLKICNYDETGHLKERLQADYWAFIPKSGSSILQMPHVIVYRADGDVWHLSANKALAWHPTMRDKITQLDLSDNVVVERTPENNAVPTKITTNTLQYFPPKEMLTTQDYIEMQQPGVAISGVGMHGYVDKNWIELHEKISTVYQPSTN